MTPGQQTLLIAVDTVDEKDFADLSFVTELTNRIQRRVFSARSAKPLSPTIKSPTITARNTTSTKLIQKLAPAPVAPPAPIPTYWPGSPVQHGNRADAQDTPEKKLQSWVMSNVTVGKIVKMKDTRDGHGYRVVTLFNFKDNTLDCVRLVRVDADKLYRYGIHQLISINDPTRGLEYFTISKFPTTHGMAKVSAVVKQDNGLNTSCAVVKVPDFSK